MPSETTSANPTGFDALLGKKERMVLFNVGTMLVLSEGQTIFTRDMRKGFFLVLNGSLQLVESPRSRNGLRFGRGDLIWERSLLDFDPTIVGICACEPSRLLYLQEAALDTIGQAEHIAILKLMADFANSHILTLRKKLASGHLQRRYMSERRIADYAHQRTEYENSELILGLMKRIPRLPIHVAQLFEMLLNEKVSAKRVTELAKQDPSLVSEVLKTVNSAHYGLRQKVSDLFYAIMLIGFNEVYQILISNGVRKVMPDTEQFKTVHQHSLVLSYIALEVCQLIDQKRASVLNTIGLLHDIGKSTILLIEKENPKLNFFIRMLDPSKMGAMLLAQWNIPQVICETIEYQEHPRFAPPGEIPSPYRENVAILHLAHAVNDAAEAGGKLPVGEYPFLGEHMKFLRLHGSFEQVFTGVFKNLRSRADLLPDEVKRFVAAGASIRVTA